METSNLSPVTEGEFMSFANRVATTLVGYSNQARELERVQAQIATYQTELSHLRDENSRINQAMGETTELAKMYEEERNKATQKLQESESRLKYHEDLAVQRDAKVHELTTRLAESEAVGRNAVVERDRAIQANDRVQNAYKHAEEELNRVQRDNDALHDDLTKAQATVKKLEDTFRSVFQQVEQVKEPEKPTSKTENVATNQPFTPPEMKPVIDEDKPVEEGPKDFGFPSRAW